MKKKKSVSKKATKKKATKKKATGKSADVTTTGAQQPLSDDWVEKIPAQLQRTCDAYVAASRSKAKAAAKENSAKDACIEAMQNAGFEKVRIDDGKKTLVLTEEPKLKISKPKKEDDA